jgi:hypothetical protein
MDLSGEHISGCALEHGKMSKIGMKIKEATHCADEHHCMDSALCWSAETSRTSRESEVHVAVDVVMVGTKLTGRHSSRSGQHNAEAGSVRERFLHPSKSNLGVPRHRTLQLSGNQLPQPFAASYSTIQTQLLYQLTTNCSIS